MSTRRIETAIAPRRGRQRVVAALVALAIGLLGALVPAVSASASGQVTVHIVDQAGVAVVGIDVDFRNFADNSPAAAPVPSDPNGDVILTLPDGDYFYYVHDGENDSVGDSFGNSAAGVSVAGADQTLPDFTVNRYADVSGVIDNWSPAMAAAGGVDVQLWYHNALPDYWAGTSYSVLSLDGTFSFPAIIFDQPYTLDFEMYDGNSPYLDAFLGGELDDPALATQLVGVPGDGFPGLTMTMPDAALITGTVTTGGTTPLDGIWINALDQPDENFDFETTTDALGQYSLYVRPGLTYAVHADDYDLIPGGPYDSMTFDGWDGCGCNFDPVTPTLAVPSPDIDFDLLVGTTALQIGGVAADDSSNYIDGIQVRLFRASGAAWVLDDVVVSDSTSPPLNFGFVLANPAQYRLQFVTPGGVVLSVIDGATQSDPFGPNPGLPVALAPVPACYADLDTVSVSLIVFAILDPATAAGTCANLDAAPSGPSGSGSGTVTSRPLPAAAVQALAAAIRPKPTATPSPTPRPSASPTPDATATSGDEPPPGPDLWWLVWLALGVIVIAIAGGVIFRRR